MSSRFIILGCGSSGGVPRIGSMWGACDPANPKNRRRRCALLVENYAARGVTRILVDTPPDLREQLLDVRVTALDGVLFTHDHADHTHGIDDLRPLAYAMKRRIACYFDEATRASVESRFAYCFKTVPGIGYPPILTSHTIREGETIAIPGPGGNVSVAVVGQRHGEISSLGFRFGEVAYSPDVSDLDEKGATQLRGLDVWIVDALRHTPHPSHFHLKKTLQWIECLRPKRAILTHMTADLDYETLCRDLPAGVEPAYDEMTITLP